MIKSNKKSKEETATMEDNVVTEKNNKETEEKQLEAMTGNNKHKSDGDDEGVKNIKKKNKTKKSKQNISVKSSFSKFDALQKRNLIHVRSINSSTAQEKFSNPHEEQKQNCRVCDKTVYKMEEIKAEKSIYHKNCFRCNECNKQLKVDTYQSHEGVLYCTVHFKLLFAPKQVEDDDSVKPHKPELIIRENQPAELPPDVVRASDKPDLGLEELQQLNVRSRFQVFEQGKESKNNDEQHDDLNKSNNTVRRSTSILSKVAKLQQLSTTGSSQQDSNESSDNCEDSDDIDFDDSSNPNADLIRQKKRDQKRERPIGIGEAMNDIRTLFEKGHGIRKEERREERKQEIQNIRSRLFMGKQARIKEMYQQAVAESEHATDKKKEEIDIEVNSKSLRERFEKGEVFKDRSDNENEGESIKRGTIEKEADVFESAISKKSRNIFMELDANLVTNTNKNIILPSQSSNKINLQHKNSAATDIMKCGETADNDVVKCDEVVDDIEIKTSEISEKFKFFEKYNPTENKKKVFRITPPREGVVKMPSPDDEDSNEQENGKELSPDRNIIAHSRTTSKMLDKFRELEKNVNRSSNNSPKPLKCFTPPPDGNRRVYVEENSDEYDSNEDDEDEDDEDDYEDNDPDSEEEYNYSRIPKDDEALIEAQNAARAKQLRIKFEKWQANEIKREKNDDNNIYANHISDDNSIESTQTIRERFEKMRSVEKQSQPTRPRHQVNRFV